MRQIYRKISLEPLKCRIPNTLVGFHNGGYVFPTQSNFYINHPNGNYGSCPSDIQLPLNFTDEKRNYDFSTVSDVLSTSINIIENSPVDIFNYAYGPDFFTDTNAPIGIEYYKLLINGNEISCDNGKTYNRYMSYSKLHNWFMFFKFYFNLLNSTTCTDSEKEYKSAVEYYYSNNTKLSGETLEYFQNIDALFVARGGVTSNTESAKCDLYDWMRDYIFLSYNIELAQVEREDGCVVKLKKYAKFWKNTKLNIVALMYWYGWFNERFKKYQKIEDCSILTNKKLPSLTKEDILNLFVKDFWGNEIDTTTSTLEDLITYIYVNTDCCECEEYQKLGGNDMFLFLKLCVEDYETKSGIIEEYCTNTATINVQIPINVSFNNIGEGSILSEEWEGGVDYSPNKDYMPTDKYLGTTIRYGGTSFYKEDCNEQITVQDSIFVSSTKDYLKKTGHDETKQGYYYNKYKELGFIKGVTETCSGNINDEKFNSIYSEYLPYYINDHLEEFSLFDNEKVKTYAYSENNFVKNPTIHNMCTDYTIIESSNNTHLFYVDNKLYESELHYVLVDSKKNEISIGYNPIFIQFDKNDDKSVPFIEYKGKIYFGYYIKNTQGKGIYRFTFKQIPKHESDWFDISETKNEYVYYNDCYIKLKNGKLPIYYNKDGLSKGMMILYDNIDGYISNNSVENPIVAIVKKINNVYYCVNLIIDNAKEENEFTLKCQQYDETQFAEHIDNLDTWESNKKSGYWIDRVNDTLILHFVKQYTTYQLGEIHGQTKSRLIELEDFAKTHDKLGNIIGGLYCGKNTIPTDNELLDFYYHIGNATNLSYITGEADSTQYVFEGKKSTNVDYYWGNLISGIKFYFKDKRGDILYDTVVEVPNIFITQPTKKEYMIYNLKYVENCLKNYIKTYYLSCGNSIPLSTLTNMHVGDLIYSASTGNKYSILQITEVDYSGEEDNIVMTCDYIEYTSLKEQIRVLNEKMYCEITYNIGAIIQRPWYFDYYTDSYIYGLYGLTDNYHHGVEYKEECTIGVGECTYYHNNNRFFNVNFMKLDVTNIVTYYLDEYPDEDSEIFSANTAYFSMETCNHNMVNPQDCNKSSKYTCDINSSVSDGRQFNFYNGLMASPTFVEEYNLGITSLRNVNENIYVNRGVNYAYDKHLKLLEIKTLESLENYGNGFYNIIDNNN